MKTNVTIVGITPVTTKKGEPLSVVHFQYEDLARTKGRATGTFYCKEERLKKYPAIGCTFVGFVGFYNNRHYVKVTA